MRKAIDQMGRNLMVPDSARRIVSTVPSQTELLFDLGLGDRIVGRTKFCIHPKEFVGEIPIIGGTKNLHIPQIKELNPDLIIGNKEENEQDQILSLAADLPVWLSDIQTWDDGVNMILALSNLLGVENKGIEWTQKLKESKQNYTIPNHIKLARVLYLIWQDPIMAVGKNTYIDHMLSIFGVQNALSDYDRYPELSEEEIRKITPTHIFLSSEPFPFKEKHISQYQRICPGAVITIVDGELFSWYGSRMLMSIEYFRKLSQLI